ncbi:MAG: hypothetical protein ACRCXL_06995 [Dermatophilaceae bacterium]
MSMLRRAIARDRVVRAVAAASPRGALDEVVRYAQQTRSREIDLLPVPLTGADMSGVWLRTSSRDVIAYPADATPLRQNAVVCHEVAHMLLGHDPSVNPQLPDVLHGVAPDLDPEVAERFLSHPDLTAAAMRGHAYRTPYERDAEVVGTRIVAHLRRASAVGDDPASRALR